MGHACLNGDGAATRETGTAQSRVETQIVATARSNVRKIVDATSLLLKHQLPIVNRARGRAANLHSSVIHAAP